MKNNAMQLTLISVLVILLAVLAAVGLYMLAPEGAPPVLPGEEAPEALVAKGRLPGYESSPINTNPEAFYYLIGSEINFPRPDAQGDVMIENTTGNSCKMQVNLELMETGETVYTSPVMDPDSHIVRDRLEVLLEPGTYDVVAKIYALDLVTDEVRGTFTEQITIVVKNKLF